MLQTSSVELIRMYSHGSYRLIELGTLFVTVLEDSSW